MSYFKYNDKKIYYEEMGKGTPLLFLHGNTASSNMFLEIINKYTDSFKVILIDFLGIRYSIKFVFYAINPSL